MRERAFEEALRLRPIAPPPPKGLNSLAAGAQGPCGTRFAPLPVEVVRAERALAAGAQAAVRLCTGFALRELECERQGLDGFMGEADNAQVVRLPKAPFHDE